MIKQSSIYFLFCFLTYSDEPTLAMKREASITDCICLSQPDAVRPDRKELIDGFFSSHTVNIGKCSKTL